MIEPGLTGVVGPNGCGKSNLLEALRWVMGETSHKSMRAAAMDDVIFSGTNTRPARNSAEVTIFLDNAERKAPAEFNDNDVIEITRRIEREAGSAYRINGREARARDVKILFEDAATGARSPALVRQGQIGEIVNAKPEQRRRILEDAAGIAGLHSRRHEAELRLKATEANLARLNDVLGQLNSQVESLKRQARAARRYKEISGDIRRQEALLFHLSWADAQALVETEEADLKEALATLGAATQAESRRSPRRRGSPRAWARCARRRPSVAVRRPPAPRAGDLRAGGAAASATASASLAPAAEQLGNDIAREDALIAEAREILGGLDAEVAALRQRKPAPDAKPRQARAPRAPPSRPRSEKRRSPARRAHRQGRGARAPSGRAWKRASPSAARRCREARASARRARRRRRARSPAARPTPRSSRRSRTPANASPRRSRASRCRPSPPRALTRDRAVDAADGARAQHAKARLALASLRAERETLVKLLIGDARAEFPPILDRLRVAAGYEAALGAALGDDLEAPAAEDAPVHWRHVAVHAPGRRAPRPASSRLPPTSRPRPSSTAA